MKIVLISGSARANSQSLKVAKWLENHLQELEAETEFIDLQKVAWPLVHEDIWDDINNHPAAQEVQQKLDMADGFVVVSPEWNGMASPALKNFFLYVKRTMAHKPALLATASGSRGGAYPIAELRMSSYKNTHINYIPEHLIVRDAENFMNDIDVNTGEKDDQYLKNRAVYCLKVLLEYAKALRSVRESGVVDHDTYPHGM